MKTKKNAETQEHNGMLQPPSPAVQVPIYPTVMELAMLAAHMLGKPEQDEFGAGAHDVVDVDEALSKALTLWRRAAQTISDAQALDTFTQKGHSDFSAQQQNLEELYTRMKKRVAEAPGKGASWTFGKVASKLIPAGTKDAPKQLEEILMKGGLAKRESVDQLTFERWGLEVEKVLMAKEKERTREKMKALRKLGKQKK